LVEPLNYQKVIIFFYLIILFEKKDLNRRKVKKNETKSAS